MLRRPFESVLRAALPMMSLPGERSACDPRTGVFDICRRFAEQGRAGLASGPRGPAPGTGRFLEPQQEAQVRALISRHTPDELGLPFTLWSRASVRMLIERHCGVRLAVRTSRHLSGALGLHGPEAFHGHFSIRRFKVKRFRAVLPLRCLMSLAGPCFSSGSALWLSQYGIRRMRRSNLLRVLIAQNAIDTSALANSPHPSSREGRLSTGWRKLVYLSVRATGCSTGPIRRSPQHPPSSSGTRFRRSRGGA